MMQGLGNEILQQSLGEARVNKNKKTITTKYGAVNVSRQYRCCRTPYGLRVKPLYAAFSHFYRAKLRFLKMPVNKSKDLLELRYLQKMSNGLPIAMALCQKLRPAGNLRMRLMQMIVYITEKLTGG